MFIPWPTTSQVIDSAYPAYPFSSLVSLGDPSHWAWLHCGADKCHLIMYNWYDIRCPWISVITWNNIGRFSFQRNCFDGSADTPLGSVSDWSVAICNVYIMIWYNFWIYPKHRNTMSIPYMIWIATISSDAHMMLMVLNQQSEIYQHFVTNRKRDVTRNGRLRNYTEHGTML